MFHIYFNSKNFHSERWVARASKVHTSLETYRGCYTSGTFEAYEFSANGHYIKKYLTASWED